MFTNPTMPATKVSLSGKKNDLKTKIASLFRVIERRDNVVNLCEVKYTAGQFVVSAEYEQALLDKVDAFQRETGTAASILLTLITSFGVKQNSHSGCIQKELTAEALFGQ